MEDTRDTHGGTDTPSHDAGTNKGEENAASENEPGRYDKGEAGADRPAGGTTARNSTSINPEDAEPIHPDSPNLPPA
ncbi:MAG TPA: hypothetical protein VGO50_00810 [Pyrinomonadaceae bacterium]|jgi:hypothetical protein|nr:hypothetical protein [Pyrinomonadaceae bacterium]